MKIEHYSPAECLKPFIKTFIIIESEQETENRLLPDTSIVLAFRFKGSISDKGQDNNYVLPASVITGLRKSPRLVRYWEKTANLLVLFREGGAAAFFKEPLHELFSKSLPLDDLIHCNKLQQIEEQLNEAQSNQQRINIIERFLFTMLNNRKGDQLIDHAIKQIRIVKGHVKIRDMVKSFPLSLDPFEKRFRRAVGISPKQFADIIRFRNLIDHYSDSESLTTMALTAGYFDQAHFIKDFRAFAGLAPQQFFKSTPRW